MADQNERDYFNRRLSSMKQERESFINHWKDLSDFVQPRRGRFFISDRNKGDRRYQSIINSKATQALRIARSGLLSGVMSPSRPWFSLELRDTELMEHTPVKLWLHEVEERMRAVFNASNLYNMAPVMLGELLLFGTGCMTQVDDPEDLARFFTHTVGSYMISQNSNYIVDTLVREYENTVEQIVARFGLGNVSRAIRDQYDRSNYGAWYPIVHFIEPNKNRNGSSRLARNKAWRSVYYEPGNNDKDQYLKKSGFDEFPAYVPRWDVTGEDIYGTDCPGMTSLGDIKGLQTEEKRKAQAIDKMVNPPLSGPPSVRNVPISSLPGGLNVYDASGGQKLESLYDQRVSLQDLVLDIEKVERRIDTAFFVDMFLAISNMEGIQPRNELDLAHRNQERLLQIGPVLERLHGELLDKMINRTFNQMQRAGVLPPPPPELEEGTPIEIKYISTLAMAQRAVGTTAIDRLAGYVGGLVGAGFTDVLDKFDADQSVDEYARLIGVPPAVVRSDDMVEQRRAERARQEQQMRAMEMAQQGAAAAQQGAQAAKTVEETLREE